jgi:hypothetical protein
MGPPNQHVDEKNAVEGWGWEGDQACVAVDLAPLAGQAPAGPGGDVAGKTAPHKHRRNNMTGGKPPRVSNIVKMVKNVFSEFKCLWKCLQPCFERLSGGKPI